MKGGEFDGDARAVTRVDGGGGGGVGGGDGGDGVGVGGMVAGGVGGGVGGFAEHVVGVEVALGVFGLGGF